MEVRETNPSEWERVSRKKDKNKSANSDVGDKSKVYLARLDVVCNSNMFHVLESCHEASLSGSVTSLLPLIGNDDIIKVNSPKLIRKKTR